MIRVLKDKNLTFTDYTNELNLYKTLTATMNIATGTDYIYFGQRFPFNHLYFLFDTVNDQACTVTIQYYDGTNWRNAVDVLDETSTSSTSFGQNGFITFSPNKLYRWNKEDTVKSDGTENIDGLGSVTIYDQYWLRLSFDATLKNTTALKWVGNLFCNENDLFAENPRLNNSDLLDSVESGKTTWEEQRVIGTKLVISDLERRGIIVHNGQILDKEKMRLMSVSKTASLIYNMLGDDWFNDRDQANKDFNERKVLGIYNVDTTKNALLDDRETLRPMTLVRR